MAGQQESSFLESFGRIIGQLPMGIKSPLMEKTIELQLAKEKRQLDEQLARQQIAFDQVVELERQKELSADWQKDYDNKPEAEGLHGPIPEFGKTDQLRLYQQYGQAGLDPEKIAEAQQAELAADAFRRGLANITNDAALVNIGMGHEYTPVKLVDGNFINQYDTNDYLLGTTAKNQAETRKAKSEADEQEQRLRMMNNISDSVMRMNAFNKKELGKPVEVVIEGENGESNIVLASQDSSGKYRPQVLADTASGNPLVIPPEAAGGDELREIRLARALKEHGVVESEAEGLELAVYGKTKSDDTFLESRLIANAQGPYGNRNSDKKILTATFDDFVRARYGSSFPTHFIDEVNRSTTMKPAEKEALIQQIEDYNFKVFEMGLTGQQTTQPPIVPQAATGTGPPETAITNRGPATQKPLWNLDNIQFQQQPGLQLPDMPVPDMSVPQPAAPVTIPEQPEIPDFQVITETILNNNGPAEINAALKKQGFDVSPENMSAMAIDAVNRGENPVEIQQLLQLLGIQWTPPA